MTYFRKLKKKEIINHLKNSNKFSTHIRLSRIRDVNIQYSNKNC